MGKTMECKLEESERKEARTLSAEKVKYGDWLSYQERIVQVVANNHYTAIVKDDQGIISCAHYQDLEPLKLSDAIFADNGWSYADEEYTKEYKWFKMCIDMLYPELYSVGVSSHLDYVHLTNIYYVHELQHILTTLRTNDNIRL